MTKAMLETELDIGFARILHCRLSAITAVLASKTAKTREKNKGSKFLALPKNDILKYGLGQLPLEDVGSLCQWLCSGYINLNLVNLYTHNSIIQPFIP